MHELHSQLLLHTFISLLQLHSCLSSIIMRAQRYKVYLSKSISTSLSNSTLIQLRPTYYERRMPLPSRKSQTILWYSCIYLPWINVVLPFSCRHPEGEHLLLGRRSAHGVFLLSFINCFAFWTTRVAFGRTYTLHSMTCIIGVDSSCPADTKQVTAELLVCGNL